MSAAQLVLFPRGQLTPQQADHLLAFNILAVECDDPSKVVTVIPGAPLAGANDLFMAALYAAVDGGEGRRFASELYRRLKSREHAEGGAS